LTSILFAGAPSASASCDVGGGDALTIATASAFSPPDPPQNLTVMAGNKHVVLFWAAPEFDGGGIDFYRVYMNGAPTLKTTARQVQVNGLTNGQTYTFAVTANNDCGESAPSNQVYATPNTGHDAELIRGSNLAMSTGNKPTAADPFVGKQVFPAGTTGLGTLDEEPDNGFCNGSCLANQVLVNSLQNGSLGGPSYVVSLLYDKTVLAPPGGLARAVTGFIVWYDATKGQNPVQLSSCASSAVPCVVKTTVNDGDLTVQVRTDDLDPRLGTSR
jgi:fibronectin type III domain protein